MRAEGATSRLFAGCISLWLLCRAGSISLLRCGLIQSRHQPAFLSLKRGSHIHAQHMSDARKLTCNSKEIVKLEQLVLWIAYAGSPCALKGKHYEIFGNLRHLGGVQLSAQQLHHAAQLKIRKPECNTKDWRDDIKKSDRQNENSARRESTRCTLRLLSVSVVVEYVECKFQLCLQRLPRPEFLVRLQKRFKVHAPPLRMPRHDVDDPL